MRSDSEPRAAHIPSASWRPPLTPGRLATISLILTASLLSAASGPVKPSTLEELRAAIQAELDEVGQGSIGVALVSKDAAIWASGIAMADPSTRRKADENTYWRRGSISNRNPERPSEAEPRWVSSSCNRLLLL